MRLTLNHLRRAPQFTNAILQREVDLRGLGLSSLDETALVLLNNEFDVINLTSNALTSLEYFPTVSGESGSHCMDRVTTLIAHRNQIQKVSAVSCARALPNLVHFLADRNNFKSVRDLLFLKHWRKLEVLSLEGCPVWEGNPEGFSAAKVRTFLIFLCPSLKLVNYARVLQRDRDAVEDAKKEFKALSAQWTDSTAISVSADGKRIRKRGRENRALGSKQGVSAPAAPVSPTAPSGPDDKDIEEKGVATPPPGARVEKEEEHNEDTLQARLNELEERIMSDDITSEEIVALEQEMNEILAAQERRKKRRK